MLLFAIFSYVQHGVREEKRVGTVAFFFRFLFLSTFTLILFTAVCGITGFRVDAPASGLWAMLFCDLVIEAMQNPDQPRPLCCFPVMLKAKYYPWVLIIIFSLIFNFAVDFWCGLAVGYMFHYGLFSKCTMGVEKATSWETSFPFKYWVDKEYFIRAAYSSENSISGPVGTVLNRNGAASNFPAPGGGSSNPAAANSSNASFKSFSGKGVSLGGGSSASAPSAGAISSMLRSNN